MLRADSHKIVPISGKTQLLGILGDPIEHVMSPVMQNRLLEHAKLDYVYIPLHVSRDNLELTVSTLRKINMVGFNITIPHKVSIVPLVDELDPTAKKIGAINTVKNVGGRLIGKNTDGEGAIKSLLDNKIRLRDQNITILGAGGAARAIIYNLLKYSHNITILNRSSKSLNELIIDITQKSQISLRGELLTQHESCEAILKQTDLLINTTPVGMFPNIQHSPIPSSWLYAHTTVFDIIYSPLQTKLLLDAQTAGCTTLGGLEMLLNQGALAFQWWTGEEANMNLMRDSVIELLDPKEK